RCISERRAPTWLNGSKARRLMSRFARTRATTKRFTSFWRILELRLKGCCVKLRRPIFACGGAKLRGKGYFLPPEKGGAKGWEWRSRKTPAPAILGENLSQKNQAAALRTKSAN